jgi:hypothetical protein
MTPYGYRSFRLESKAAITSIYHLLGQLTPRVMPARIGAKPKFQIQID